MDQPTSRALFATGWGAVLTTAGAAIGLGNIWRFPYMMGEYGGSAFLALYLLLVVAFGVPGLMAEYALGRHTRLGPVGAFHGVSMPGATAWSILLLVTIAMAGSYYGVILADVLYDGVAFGRAALGGPEPAERGSTGARYGCVVVTVGLSCVAITLGLRRGIERLSTIGLPFFFVLFVGLIVYVLRLPGALDGLRQFLKPRPQDLTAESVLAALGQAFFSLGLGGTLMVMYGSYLREKDSIARIAAGTAAADVGAALLAGMIIVPAVHAFEGIELDRGPRLMFEVMPAVFGRMAAGNLIGALFFWAVFIVGLLSLIGAYEVVVGAAVDRLGWSRLRAAAAVGAAQIALSVPALYSDAYIGWSDFIWGTSMMPIGSVLAVVALAWCVSRAKALEQIARHSRTPGGAFLYYWIKYVLPLGIGFMLIYGWIGKIAEIVGGG